MSSYSGIQEVQPARKSSGDTKWITPGKYELEITRVGDGKVDQGAGSPYFVVEFEVVTARDSQYEIGDSITWMTKRNKYAQYFLQDVQNFICAATKSTPSEVTQDVVETCTGEAQPLVGERVNADAYNKVMESSGKEFTVVSFRSLRD